MGEFLRFEIEQDEAFEQIVIEDDIKVAGLGADAELSPDEGDAFSISIGKSRSRLVRADLRSRSAWV